MNVLIIEDENTKLEAISRLVSSQRSDLKILAARSVRTGRSAIQADPPACILLDMSLPTFDISASEPGGRPQGNGGIEILRYLDAEELRPIVVIVSAYSAFAKDGRNIGLQAFSDELIGEFPELVKGVVYFDPIQAEWSRELLSLLNKHIPEALE
ncbi:MAG: hypothetical protein Q8Q73_16390 [Stagnimonas sp.]|nr:hypothetical protein [Stagnimonas sp.]